MGVKFPSGEDPKPTELSSRELAMVRLVVAAVADDDVFENLLLAALRDAPCPTTALVMRANRKKLLQACGDRKSEGASQHDLLCVASSFSRFVTLLNAHGILPESNGQRWTNLANKVLRHRGSQLAVAVGLDL